MSRYAAILLTVCCSAYAQYSQLTNSVIDLMVRTGVPIAVITQRIRSAEFTAMNIDGTSRDEFIRCGASGDDADQIIRAMNDRANHTGPIKTSVFAASSLPPVPPSNGNDSVVQSARRGEVSQSSPFVASNASRGSSERAPGADARPVASTNSTSGPERAILRSSPRSEIPGSPHHIDKTEEEQTLAAVFADMAAGKSFGSSGFQPEKLFIENNDSINAFAKPDGSVHVTDGLMQVIQADKGMLAFVLGHEMAHVQLKHSLRDYERAVERAQTIRRFEARCQAGENASCIANATYQVSSAILEKKIERDEENAADYLGMLAAAEAGYHPDYSILVARRLRGATGDKSKFAAFFSDHPRWTTREERAEKHYEDAVARFNNFWPSVDRSPGGRPPALAVIAGIKIDKGTADHVLHASVRVGNLEGNPATMTVTLRGETNAQASSTLLKKELAEKPGFEDLVVNIPRAALSGSKGHHYVQIAVTGDAGTIYSSDAVKVN